LKKLPKYLQLLIRKKMPEKNIVHLFIPHLLQPLNGLSQDTSFELDIPSLSLLLKRFSKIKNSQLQSIDIAFFRTLQAGINELPIAYYRHQVETNEIKDGLICADPIHLEVGMNDVTLSKKITDLTETEAKELIAILNKHFKDDGIKFTLGSNQNWYVSFIDENYSDETFESYDLDSVLKQNITDKLATSSNRNWRVIQNETQMLLHSSEINKHREMAGLDTVNSLWFWGAGKPINTNFKIDKIFTSNETASKLRGQLFAKAADSEWYSFSENSPLISSQLGSKTSRKALILDQLFSPALENNLDAYQQALSALDRDILKPLLKLWENNEIEIIIDCCDGTILKPHKSPSWKFWSKPKNSRELINEINS